MKVISQKKGVERLGLLRRKFALEICEKYEKKAKGCLTCQTPGACCLDEHFVNVRISRLEGRAIKEQIELLPEASRKDVYRRIEETIEKYDLREPEISDPRTYACPLFEKGLGCLVHDTAKPLPCIAHACYDRKEDLPPEELLAEREIEIDRLNRRVYGGSSPLLPLPTAIRR